MAAKFMEISKVEIPLLTAILLVSRIIGQKSSNNYELAELINGNGNNIVTYEEAKLFNQGSKVTITPIKIDTDELELWFEMAYEFCGGSDESNKEEQIALEIDSLSFLCDTKLLPDDYEKRYLAWRNLEH